MGHRVQLQFITSTRRRHATYWKRFRGLKKKVQELATLCNIPVLLLCDGISGLLETYPDDNHEVADIIERYLNFRKPCHRTIPEFAVLQKAVSKLEAVRKSIQFAEQQELTMNNIALTPNMEQDVVGGDSNSSERGRGAAVEETVSDNTMLQNGEQDDHVDDSDRVEPVPIEQYRQHYQDLRFYYPYGPYAYAIPFGFVRGTHDDYKAPSAFHPWPIAYSPPPTGFGPPMPAVYIGWPPIGAARLGQRRSDDSEVAPS